MHGILCLRSTLIRLPLSNSGWNLGDQGMWCKQTLFETNAQIPLLVFVPWLPQSHGQRVAALVEAVDIYPSLTDLVGISHTIQDWDELEGDSFLPLLLNPAVPAVPRGKEFSRNDAVYFMRVRGGKRRSRRKRELRCTPQKPWLLRWICSGSSGTRRAKRRKRRRKLRRRN